jgi:hypothetical protein
MFFVRMALPPPIQKFYVYRTMHTVQRPRRYVSPVALTAMRPVLRYSSTRDAFVLRVVGSYRGPVLRRERRIAPESEYDGSERRNTGAPV